MAADEQGKAPGLVALFLIKFDLKVGYTIAWKRSLEQVPLDGVVEYKSLPSGLHNVDKDLVYFFHDKYAGVSAFAKGAADESERNAHFVAVGGLLPLRDGRLGRAWVHAGGLEELASRLVSDASRLDLLEEYWQEHGIADVDAAKDFFSPQLSPFSVAQSNTRAMSSLTLVTTEQQRLPPSHPALSMLQYLDAFGPLIFPLHRAALLRKRILMVTAAPVKKACEFVYDLSVLSSAPQSLASSLVLPSQSLARLKPLFCVGIHDIPFLETLASNACRNSTEDDHDDPHDPHMSSWVACTTDEILATKSQLYDILVELPSSHLASDDSENRPRPVIKTSDGKTQIKATQRDLRRYRMLRRALRPALNEQIIRSSREETNDATHLLFRSKTFDISDSIHSDRHDLEDDEDELIEPTTWSALVYSSFMWWASAGERDENLIEEEESDRMVLSDLGDVAETIADERRYRDDEDDDDDNDDEPEDRSSLENSLAEDESSGHGAPARKDARMEMALIAYFHRLTTKLFDVCAQVVLSAEPDQGDDEIDDGEENLIVNDVLPIVDRDELRRMGLDVWSSADAAFVNAFCQIWFERAVSVRSSGVECCGVRIC